MKLKEIAMKKNGCNKKYKDRNPEETVLIIKEFFKKRGFEIKETLCCETPIATYVCGIDLFYDNIKVSHSNGKGTTMEYSRASGYAELYERFCNKFDVILKPFTMKKIMEYNNSKNGFCIAAGERLLTFEETIKEPLFLELFEKIITLENYEYILKIYKKIYSNFLGVPFKKVGAETEIKYLDLRMLFLVCGSSGMAAGNTLEEALVQGISEICERHVMVDLLTEHINNNQFYYIDLDSIENTELISILNNLKNKGNDIYIFDLSYNYNLPVIATLVVNTKTNNFDINYASHPIFDIALERTLTELYQADDYEDNITKSINNPLLESNISDVLRDCASSAKKYFPEFLLINSKKIDGFNEKFFLHHKKYNNKELLEIVLNHLESKKIELYYYNSSLINNMYAVYIYSPNVKDMGSNIIKNNLNECLTTEKCYSILKFLDAYDSLICKGEFVKSKKFLTEFLKTIFLHKTNFYLDLFGCTDIMSLYYKNEHNCLTLCSSLNETENLEKIYSYFSDSFYNIDIKLVLLIKMYWQSEKYSIFEIKKLFSFLDVSEDFIDNCDLIIDGILIPYYKEYNSDRYQKYATTYCK